MSKNKKKKASLSPAVFALLILTAISLGATGVFHTVLKNQQVERGPRDRARGTSHSRE